MKFFHQKLLYSFIGCCLLFVLSSATGLKNNRMVEGKIYNKTTNKPLAVNIEIYREGQSWVVRSNEEGWYSVSLPVDRAYAVKVHQLDDYRKYTEAFFLEELADKKDFTYNIELLSKE